MNGEVERRVQSVNVGCQYATNDCREPPQMDSTGRFGASDRSTLQFCRLHTPGREEIVSVQHV